jgi:hypothetical protein
MTFRHRSLRYSCGAWASRTSSAAIGRSHDSRATWFGHVAETTRRPTELRRRTANHVPRLSWFDTVIAALRQQCLRRLPVAWRIPRPREVFDETVFETFGAVEIRRMPAACYVRTCVHGEPSPARDTALRRLTNYLNGDNRGGAILHAVRPVIQQQLGPHRWQVSVRLPQVSDSVVLPAPRAPKVKLWSAQPGWFAFVRMSGRPAHTAVSGGDAIVLNAIANSDWVATGAPMIRLQVSGPLQWFTSGFEVAVPVAPRFLDDVRNSAGSSVRERLSTG